MNTVAYILCRWVKKRDNDILKILFYENRGEEREYKKREGLIHNGTIIRGQFMN